MDRPGRKDIYLTPAEERAIRLIIEHGFAESTSAAVRLAIRQFAAAIVTLPPLVMLTTPVS